jgi:hypothetical protein
MKKKTKDENIQAIVEDIVKNSEDLETTGTDNKSFYESINKYEKYEVNPFVEEAIKKVQEVTARKTRKIGADKSAQHIIVDSNGEFEGYAQFVQVVEVDEERFAKVYISHFAAFYELSDPAIRVFHYVISTLKPKSDKFTFRIDKCLELTGYKTKKSVFNGLGNLIKNGIIARSMYPDEYFINPMVAFNGDRIAYTRAYIKKKKNVENPNQTMLFPL